MKTLLTLPDEPTTMDVRQCLDSLKQRGSPAMLDFVERQLAVLASRRILTLTDDVRDKLLLLPLGVDSGLSKSLSNVSGSRSLLRVLGDFTRARQYLEALPPEQAEMLTCAMTRYFLEGLGEYQSDDAPLRFLQERGEMPEASKKRLIDFGAAQSVPINAPYVDEIVGIDMSPTFVLNDPNRMRLGFIDAPTPELRQQIGDLLKGNIVMSSLTLDRVRDPKQLIRNMIQALFPTGLLCLGTLLPVNPVDDGENVEDRIVYTPQELRLTNGVDVEEDKAQIVAVLEEMLDKPGVRVDQVPYTVRCSDGEQVFDNYYLFRAEKAPGPPDDPITGTIGQLQASRMF